MDKRFLKQLLSLSVLIALPVTMIAVNGIGAMHAILTPVRSGGDVATDSSKFVAVFAPVTTATDIVSRDNVTPNSVPPDIVTTGAQIRFGVYDPGNVFTDSPNLSLRHLYISWVDFSHSELAGNLASLRKRGFEPLLTIEPWPKSGGDRQLLADIANGHYDHLINDLAAILNKSEAPVWISWGHEMDQDLTRRYPWSGAEPSLYIAAYRHFVDRIREQVQIPLHWVWAGVLKEGSQRYWPGNEYVDVIGMPIYSFPAWDQRTYGYIRDFRTTFEEKRKIVADIDKPVMITELGVCGSDDFESFWLHQAFKQLRNYPDLAAVLFFYASDSEGAWGDAVTTPDWRVHPDSIRGLVDWNLRQSQVDRHTADAGP